MAGCQGCFFPEGFQGGAGTEPDWEALDTVDLHFPDPLHFGEPTRSPSPQSEGGGNPIQWDSSLYEFSLEFCLK